MTFVPLLEVGARTGDGDGREGAGIGDSDDPMFTLQATKQHGVAYGLRAANTSSNGWGVQEEQAQTLDGASPHIVAFQQNERDEVRLVGGDGQVAGALAAEQDSHQQNYLAVAFTERTRKDGRNLEAQSDLAYALTNPGAGGRTQERRIMQGMTVRRLTPTECLRLQGLPDDWFDGLDLSDSAKYRLCGNAVAVPVVAWIAARMAAVNGGAP